MHGDSRTDHPEPHAGMPPKPSLENMPLCTEHRWELLYPISPPPSLSPHLLPVCAAHVECGRVPDRLQVTVLPPFHPATFSLSAPHRWTSLLVRWMPS